MGLRINTNIAALNAQRTLANTTNQLNRSLERLSSGLRINRARDDAAGLAIAEGFRSVVRGTAVASRNAQDGIGLVQTAEGGLSTQADIVQRIRELAVQSANGSLSAANRTSLQGEVDQLIAQINAIASNTEFNGVNPLNSTTTLTLQVGARNGQTLDIGLTTVRARTQELGLGAGTPGAFSIATQTDAQAALTTLDTVVNNINTRRATLGGIQNRLEFTIQTLDIQRENSAASESFIRDADIATETIAFTRNQILVSAGTSVLAQANIVPQTALTLLG
jgi:flagellin